jgi:hypothetical protein
MIVGAIEQLNLFQIGEMLDFLTIASIHVWPKWNCKAESLHYLTYPFVQISGLSQPS